MANARGFTHRFSDGTLLEAFSVDPHTDPEEVVKANLAKPALGQAALESLAKQLPVVFDVTDLREVPTVIIDQPYEVPEVLRPFSAVVVQELLAKNPSMFPGPIIAYARREEGMELRRANYFDFLSTNRSFDKVPANYAGNPSQLPESKTLAEIVNEGRVLTRADMVNYLGQAFFVIADGQLGYVQRATGLGIAAGIPATAGGTPPFDDYHTRASAMLRGVSGLTDEQRTVIYANARKNFGPESQCPVGFFAPDFSFPDYIIKETAKEMNEEFLMKPEEFDVVRFKVTENMTLGTASTPFIATVIRTTLSWSTLAERCYGNPGVIKEHPIIYALEASPKAIAALVDQMCMLDLAAYMGHLVTQEAEAGKY